MTKVQEIKDFKAYVLTRNGTRKTEQEIDQLFFEDKYDMPLIKDPKYQIRTGYVSGMINGVANQMIGSNPRCFTKPRSDKNEKIKEASDRIATEGNRQLRVWLRTLKNPYRKTFKTTNIRGEEWIYMIHDARLDKWDKKKHDDQTWQQYNPDAVPVIPIFYDPMTVFHDPVEDVNGQPSRVVVSFKTLVSRIKAEYPGTLKKESDDAQIDFWFYADDGFFYAEAGNFDLFGLKPNLYKRCNFVHCYTGWGLETENKDPAMLAWSRPRMLRDLIAQASTMHSNIALSAHKESHGSRTIIIPMSQRDQEADFSKFRGAADDAINTLYIPDGATYEQDKPLSLSPDVYMHVAAIEAKINMEFPGVLRGASPGTSGRQDDRASNAGLSIYESPLENNNILWAEALDLGFHICEKMDLLPVGLNKGDVDSYSELTVDLKKEDPIELSQRTSQGQMLFERNIIDHKTLLTEYMGKTSDEADKIIDQAWVDNVIRTHPAFPQMVLEAIGEEMGTTERLAQIEQQMGEQGQSLNAPPQFGAKGGQPRTGNVKTPLGREMADQSVTHEPRARV